jgi:hypothetical protein
MTDEDRTARGPLGERSGVNDNPLGASFRDGPRRTPASARTLLLQGVPFLVLAGVVVLFASR